MGAAENAGSSVSLESPMAGSPAWLRRTRVIAASLLVWAGLHYIIGAGVMPPGIERPAVLTAAGVLPAILTAAVLLVGAGVAVLVAGTREAHNGLYAVSVGVALWVAGGGTIDSWLRHLLLRPDESASPAYWRLLPEYLYWLGCTAGAMLVGAIVSRVGIGSGGSDERDSSAGAASADLTTDEAARNAAVPQRNSTGETGAETNRTGVLAALGLGEMKADLKGGLAALGTTAAIAAVGMLLLTGPRVEETHRGQVYFAVAVAFALAVYGSSRIVPLRHPTWYLLSPFVVGLVGLIVAAVDPTLPGPYRRLNNLPVHGLVRALPVEMISVGLAGVIFTLRRLPAAATPRAPQAANKTGGRP